MPLYNPFEDPPSVRAAALAGAVAALEAENAALRAENTLLVAIDGQRRRALDLLDRDRWALKQDLRARGCELASLKCKYQKLQMSRSGDETKGQAEPVITKPRRAPRRGGKHGRTGQ